LGRRRHVGFHSPNRNVARVSALVLAAIWPAARALAELQGFSPLRLEDRAIDVAACQADSGHGSAAGRQVGASLRVTAEGEIEDISFPPDTADWLKAIAKCVVERAKFVPEVRESRPALAHAKLMVTVEPVATGEIGVYGVSRVGPLTTLPRNRSRSLSDVERCVSVGFPIQGVNVVVLTATVDTVGHVRRIEAPAGAPKWAERLATCLEKRRPEYFPGSRDGVPVESVVSIPISLMSSSIYGDTDRPQAPSDPTLIEAAYRACYPPDQAAMGSVLFNFDVNTDGSVSNAKIIRSSGDPVLDKAAACILPRLTFTPMTHRKKSVKANVTWELPVRPPR
jgi:TonB family protein